MKICSKCREPKSDDQFYSNGDRPSSWCKICTKTNTRAWYSKNKKRVRAWRIEKKYGLTRDQFDAILQSQGGQCAICGSPNPKGQKDWAVDHDHVTGKVRGILCAPCNKGLGHFEDNQLYLQAAIEYLRSHAPEAPRDESDVVVGSNPLSDPTR